MSALHEAMRAQVQCLNDRTPEAGLSRYLADDARCEDRRTGVVYRGPGERSRLSKAWFAAIPDGRLELIDLHEGDGFSVAEVVARGTVCSSATPMHGALPVAGSKVEVSFCWLLLGSGGRIAHERLYWSPQQLTHAVSRVSPLDALSAREREVALYVQAGMRNGEIAALLGNSPNTVRNQLTSIFRKLDVSNRAELAALVARG